MSLDGVIQAPGGPEEDPSNGFSYGGWTAPYFDEASGKVMEKQMSGRHDLFLGRKTYEIFAAYWPEHETEWPGINDVTKYVASTTLKNPKWENTIVVKGVEDIKKIKQRQGSDLHVYGSSNLVQSLLKADVIDELWLKIFPVTLGTGKRLFGPGTMPQAFTLTESQTTPSGIIVASYKRDGSVKIGSLG